MKLFYLLMASIFCCSTAFSQTSIYGKITDKETGEELIYANIVLNKSGVFAAGASTDFEGNYSIAADPGTYDITVSYTGYPNKTISGFILKAGVHNRLDIQMVVGLSLETVIVTGYNIPLIEQDNTTSGATLTSRQIRNLPTRDISGLATSTAGLSQVDQGDALTVRGSRAAATDYYIDGIRVSGKTDRVERDKISIVKNDILGAAPVAYHKSNLDNLLGGTPSVYESKTNHVLQNTKEGIVTLTEGKIITEPVVPQFTHEEYEQVVENNFTKTRENKFSTFSIDVDYASYSNIRRYINYKQTPPREAVRIEEMVNYFNYDYPKPTDDKPFSINTELADCPWNDHHKLLHIGLQGADFQFEKASSNNLVFLIDVSGSMGSANKLPLLKKSFALLIDQLRPEDKVAIAVYAGAAGLVLPSTPVKEKETILNALNNLNSGGSTAGGAGIKLAYKVALENLMEEGNNRVILATDGDFNVGISSPHGLEQLIEEKRQSGVYLTVLGFGMGNYKDNRLEILADKGNGHYAYVDNLDEAKKVFVTELTGTLYTIAKDVKIQLDFNSKNVKSYRLIGYENRILAKEDFDDDKKDAGELGAGHTVTAIYELELNTNNSKAKLMDVKLRYKHPKESQSRFIKKLVRNQSVAVEQSSNNFRFSAAVAAFGMILKDSKYKGDADCQMVTALAEDAAGSDSNHYRREFLGLVEQYETMNLTSQR